MVSFMEDLPIPRVADDHRFGTWDENFGSASEHAAFRSREPSLSSHAVAFGNFVWGTTQKNNRSWVSWKTSFAPYRVCRVTSNRDGTVTVVATDAGTISLLRGVDGAVLATRKLVSEQRASRGCMPRAARVSFAKGRSTEDALVVEVPADDEDEEEFARCWVVSSILGKSLNHNNPVNVAEASRQMAINGPIDFEPDKRILTLRGCFLNNTTIRFVYIDRAGRLGVHDYFLQDKRTSSVTESFDWEEEREHENTSSLDLEFGLASQETSNNHPFVLFVTCRETSCTIRWFDPVLLSVACDFQIPNQCNQHRPKILAIEPLVTQSDSALALAVATKQISASSGATIYVIQALVREGVDPDRNVLSTPHIVFTIPMKASILSIALAPVTNNTGPYSFRCKVWRGSEDFSCSVFVAEERGTIGRIRLCLTDGRFDQADQLISEVGVEYLTRDPYGQFHPCEVALGRIKAILAQGNVSSKPALEIAKESFYRLSAGAISRNPRAEQSLLDAAEAVREWAATAPRDPTITEVMMALSAVTKAIEQVIRAIPHSQATQLRAKKESLEEHLAAMGYLSSISSVDPKDVRLTAEFHGARSTGELFAELVGAGYFSTARKMWDSDKSKLTPGVVVKSVLGISPRSDPRDYVTLLDKCLFPSLSINHELLSSIWLWSCKTADSFDTNHLGLDNAIFLLESIDRGTRELQVRIHSSFASYSPFVEVIENPRKRIYSPRNTSLGVSVESPQNYSSWPSSKKRSVAKSSPGPCRPNPTLLELGQIQGGAQKSPRHFVSDTKIQQEIGEVDILDENEESVETKLINAKCLKKARELGLEKTVITLGTFLHSGGSQYIAKELVRSLSSSAGSHEARCRCLSGNLKPFCEEFGVDFNSALLQYTSELCGSKNVTKKAIEESASVGRCCTSILYKCRAILLVLRAASFCGYSPSWLSQLSQNAIDWASSDLTLKSELQEAARLLLIDGIIRTYCGNQARELFRVDNLRHAMRLLDFVTQHIYHESALADALDLCDAFTHLSRSDACCSMFRHAIVAGDSDVGAVLMEAIFDRDSALAISTCERVVSYCIEMVAECSLHLQTKSNGSRQADKWKKRASVASSTACTIISIALANTRSDIVESLSVETHSKVDLSVLESLKHNFSRIYELQRDHAVFLSFSDLRSTRKLLEVAASLLDSVVEIFVSGDHHQFNTKLAKVKRACSLLSGASGSEEMDFWSAAVSHVTSPLTWKFHDDQCMDFLARVGVLGARNSIAARTTLSVAFFLCIKASNDVRTNESLVIMKQVARATSLLQDRSLISCPSNLLAPALSLGILTETICNVLARADEGHGELLDEFRKKLQRDAWSKKGEYKPVDKERAHETSSSIPRRQVLHSSWYVGDGLLLPPSETVSQSVLFCKDMMRTVTATCQKTMLASSDGTFRIHNFVGQRGAHSVSLRLLSTSVATKMCYYLDNSQKSLFGSLADSIQETITDLAQRSLGGTGNGITSGLVDSQLAVSFLLLLPIKLAFKVYRSSLPTALSTRDFGRVLTLANIGLAAGSGGTENAGNMLLAVGWDNQPKFTAQCNRLVSRAIWWKYLRHLRVDFDPRGFKDGEGKEVTKEDRSLGESGYAASLIPSMISCMSKMKEDSSSILQVVTRYAKTFRISNEVVIQRYVEFLLAPPSDGSNDAERAKDVRWNLRHVEQSVKALLPRLKPLMKRTAVLRRCVVTLESNPASGIDYDRHLLILTLYREALFRFISEDLKTKKIDPMPFEIELELIDRRRDALEILSSFFQGDNLSERPEFPSFFVPLPVQFSRKCYQDQPALCGILGSPSDASFKTFDPIKPLETSPSFSYDMATATALAPLCLPLGLPSGYIHARSLMERFRKSSLQNLRLPVFQHDLVPVFTRIESARDKAELAEWCSAQYKDNDEETLKCLDLAVKCAIKASSEIEQRLRRPNTCNEYTRSGPIQEENNALETVQRLTNAKVSVADRLALKIALCATKGAPEKSTAVERVIRKLLLRLESEIWKASDYSPDRLLEFLLSEASLLAANACLDRDVPFSISHFKHFSSLVHHACNAISDQHSHLHAGHLARRFARRWLIHGDKVEGEKPVLRSPVRSPLSESKLLSRFDALPEEDTVDFVMDLSNIQVEDDYWGDRIKDQSEPHVTSEEEPSALKIIASRREQSEISCQRVALRIALVMACQDAFFDENHVENQDENSSLLANGQPKSASRLNPKGSSSLQTRIESTGIQNSYVIERSRELLRIAFAKSGFSGWIVKEQTPMSLGSRTHGSEQRKPTTVTFAMRHRALRTASILCPQDSLEHVLREEGYLVTNCVEPDCTLKKCAFGSFIAKEIEEMGLPLPHSDLAQLSSMHFPSYARALWRHHRDGDVKGSKGRLLLLLLEMSLKDDAPDPAFFDSILSEITNLRLPRTLLLCCECIIQRKEQLGAQKDSSFLSTSREVVNLAVIGSAKAILVEVNEVVRRKSPESSDVIDTLTTLHRLAHIVQYFGESSEGQKQLQSFIEVILDVLAAVPDSGHLASGLADIVSNATLHLRKKDALSQVDAKISNLPEHLLLLLRFACRQKSEIRAESDENDQNSLSTVLKRLEVNME